jgi:hypothetical protein
MKKAVTIPPRAATLTLMRNLRNAMLHGTTQRLESYVVQWAQLDAIIAVRPLTHDDLRVHAPTIAVNMDQCSKNWALSTFLPYEAKINWVALWDPVAHRSNNDINGAIKEAELARIVYTSAPLFNYEAGPWASASWGREMTIMVDELVVVINEDHPMLLQVWPLICRLSGWTDPCDTG